MATSKTTDLFSVDQLATLELLENNIENLRAQIHQVITILSCYHTIRSYENEVVSDIHLGDLFSNENLNDMVGISIYGIEKTSTGLSDLQNIIEKNMFILKKGALK